MSSNDKAITPELVKEAGVLLGKLGGVNEMLFAVGEPDTKILPELFYMGNKRDDFGALRRDGKTLLKSFSRESVEEIRTATIRVLEGERFVLRAQLDHLGIVLPPVGKE